jgi:myosin heavy subunit
LPRALTPSGLRQGAGDREVAELILTTNVIDGEWAMGRTKVFLRTRAAKELEAARDGVIRVRRRSFLISFLPSFCDVRA